MSTLLDIAKANGVEKVISEASRVHPELTVLASFPMAGISVKSVVYTGASNTSGSFRTPNAGTADISETSEERAFSCYTAEPRIEEDRAIADRYEGGPQAWLEAKSARILDLEMLAWAKQMYYGTGTGGNSTGFPGLINIYDATNMVVDATGTTDDVATSVWLVRAAPAGNLADDGVRWRFGNNGKMAFDPVQLLPFIDSADTTKKLMKYHTSFTAYPGFQVQSLLSVVRIKKITTDNGKGLTDALLNSALAKFPVGKGPNHIFMSLRSNQQLQGSRTATSPTGSPAPWPNQILGVDGQMIPIHVTEAISNTEKLAL
jgi:hypothetical protein